MMKRRSLKYILFICIMGALVAVIAGYVMWNKPHRDVQAAGAIETTALSLYNTFIRDSAKAKSTYVNQVLNVSGTVKGVSINQEKQQIILLETSSPDASVNCTMEARTNDFKIGDQIRLKGICVGYIGGDAEMGLPGDVFLIRCYRSAKT
jgi:hypothetical protein